jgi:hypothetical protein
VTHGQVELSRQRSALQDNSTEAEACKKKPDSSTSTQNSTLRDACGATQTSHQHHHSNSQHTLTPAMQAQSEDNEEAMGQGTRKVRTSLACEIHHVRELPPNALGTSCNTEQHKARTKNTSG